MFTSDLYVQSPTTFQSALITLRAYSRLRLREGKRFHTYFEQIKNHDFLPIAKNKYILNEAYITLNNALRNVPFYNNLKIDKFSIKEKPLEDVLTEFPIIDKKTIINHEGEFINPLIRGIKIHGATSGTTGTPLSIPQTLDSVIRENAFIWRQLLWSGYSRGEKRAWIRGDMIVPVSQKKPPYWRMNWAENMLMLSSFHLKQSNMKFYIEALEKFRPKLIQSYPSSITYLANYLKDNNEYFKGDCNSIVTSSESITPEEKLLIEERFGCKVYDWYGLFERNAAIGSCEYGNYHVIDDYSYIEFEKVVEGNCHEIIGTAFNNSLFPLIRYRTGDTVDISTNHKNCPCNRNYPLINKINGRVGDYLLGDEGQKVFILNHIVKGINGILESQFVQTEEKKIDVLVVIGNNFNKSEINKLSDNVKMRLGEAMMVNVNVVDSIPRDKSGKLRQAICTI